MQVYSLLSSLKTYHPILHFTPCSLDLFIRVSSQLHGEHTVLQPFRRIELIVHTVICVLPGTFSPESSEAFEGEVPCPRTQHQNNVLRLRGEKHDISLIILHQAGVETARQAATSAKLRALAIAPRHTLNFIQCHSIIIPADTKRSPNVGSMLGRRRRRWDNSEQALGEGFVSAG